jgi:hypothetical protein
VTYQEILQAIESLPLEQQDSLLALLSQQVEQKQNGSSDNTAHFGNSNTNEQSKHDSSQGTLSFSARGYANGTLRERERSIYRVIERTPAQTAEGLQKIEKFFQKKRDLWNSMTEEERQISIDQFAVLDEYLKESRG